MKQVLGNTQDIEGFPRNENTLNSSTFLFSYNNKKLIRKYKQTD